MLPLCTFSAVLHNIPGFISLPTNAVDIVCIRTFDFPTIFQFLGFLGVQTERNHLACFKAFYTYYHTLLQVICHRSLGCTPSG